MTYRTSRKTFKPEIFDALAGYAAKCGCRSFHPVWVDEELGADGKCDFHIYAHEFEYDHLMRYARKLS